MATKTDTRKRETALERQSPMSSLSPWNGMDWWFDDLGRRGWLHPFTWETPPTDRMPKVDMLDREKEVVVRAELPGVDKDDLDVTVTRHNVTIKATTQHEEKKEEDEYYRHEISRGEFRRTLELPQSVDEAAATATFRNGVLELTLPKTKHTRRRTVRVE